MTGPVRLTRRRATALLEIYGRGLDEEQASIEDEFGVQFMRDGTLQIDDEGLLEPGDLEALHGRLERLADARAAASIIYRRYA